MRSKSLHQYKALAFTAEMKWLLWFYICVFQHKADHYLKNEMLVTILDAHGVVTVSTELLTVTLEIKWLLQFKVPTVRSLSAQTCCYLRDEMTVTIPNPNGVVIVTLEHKAANSYLRDEMTVIIVDAHGVVTVSTKLLTVTLKMKWLLQFQTAMVWSLYQHKAVCYFKDEMTVTIPDAHGVVTLWGKWSRPLPWRWWAATGAVTAACPDCQPGGGWPPDGHSAGCMYLHTQTCFLQNTYNGNWVYALQAYLLHRQDSWNENRPSARTSSKAGNG